MSSYSCLHFILYSNICGQLGCFKNYNIWNSVYLYYCFVWYVCQSWSFLPPTGLSYILSQFSGSWTFGFINFTVFFVVARVILMTNNRLIINCWQIKLFVSISFYSENGERGAGFKKIVLYCPLCFGNNFTLSSW